MPNIIFTDGIPPFTEINYDVSWQEVYLPTYKFIIDLLKTKPFDFNNLDDEKYFYYLMSYFNQRTRLFLFEAFKKLEEEGFLNTIPYNKDLKIDFGMCNNYMFTVYYLPKT
jgi:hypothetical protein